MPLEHSSSPAAFHRNVKTLMGDIGHSPHVQSRNQALAIAYETQRRAGRAYGGGVGYDDGGAVQSVIQALSSGVANNTGTMGSTNPMQPSSPDAMAATMPPPAGLAPPASLPPNVVPQNTVPPKNLMPPLMAFGGVANYNMAKSPHLSMPWFARNEARSMHSGPVIGHTPGRADKRFMTVPSGSYILPSSHVSAMGQGNTLAGMKAAESMFGRNGPYGAAIPKMGHGMGMPKPPKPMGFSGGGGLPLDFIRHQGIYIDPWQLGGPHVSPWMSDGGSRGDGEGEPTPVQLSDGEYGIHPSIVRAIGKGSLKNGHALLDAYVIHARKKEIEKLKKLPPPAKD